MRPVRLLAILVACVTVYLGESVSPKLKETASGTSRWSNCGQSRFADAGEKANTKGSRFTTKRIVGGRSSRHGEWPWMVSLRNSDLDVRRFVVQKDEIVHNNHYCGGVLISTRWVLSAKHCFKDVLDQAEEHNHKWIRLSNPRDWTAVVGEHEMLREDRTELEIPIEKVVLAPKYEVGHKSKFSYSDLALLKLSRPVPLSDYAHPACLAGAGDAAQPGDTCIVAGWGKMEQMAMEHSTVLRHAKVNVLKSVACARIYTQDSFLFKKYQPGEICAAGGSYSTDACQYDSGGPLMCWNWKNNRWAISGIVSRGIGCALAYIPGIYANVTSNIDWIERTISKE